LLEDVIAARDLVLPMRRLPADGHAAWAQVLERRYEGLVAKDDADSWPGLRWIATSMRAEGHALTLQRAPAGWTATLTFIGNTNLPPAAPSGLATMPTPWEAAQWAARQVVERSAA